MGAVVSTLPSSVLVASIESGAAANETFTQAAQGIQAYTSWVESISSTGDATLDTALTTFKTHAMEWYNTIFPTYLNMPKMILEKASDIDNDLDVLVSLADQLASNDTKALQDSIVQYAGSLAQTLKALQTYVDALVATLTNFQSNLVEDSRGYETDLGEIRGDLARKQNLLAAFHSQLNHLQSAACPSSTLSNSRGSAASYLPRS